MMRKRLNVTWPTNKENLTGRNHLATCVSTTNGSNSYYVNEPNALVVYELPPKIISVGHTNKRGSFFVTSVE